MKLMSSSVLPMLSLQRSIERKVDSELKLVVNAHSRCPDASITSSVPKTPAENSLLRAPPKVVRAKSSRAKVATGPSSTSVFGNAYFGEDDGVLRLHRHFHRRRYTRSNQCTRGCSSDVSQILFIVSLARIRQHQPLRESTQKREVIILILDDFLELQHGLDQPTVAKIEDKHPLRHPVDFNRHIGTIEAQTADTCIAPIERVLILRDCAAVRELSRKDARLRYGDTADGVK